MPRPSGYFDHVRARNELSIFKQAPKPIMRTTAPADSTTEPIVGRKRKQENKKKTKGKKKKKKRGSSSSSASDESEDDDDELDPDLYDLNTPLFSIAKYIKNPEEMVSEMFRSVEKSKLKNMLSENIKKIDTEELKTLCVQQLEGMSKKRIRSILSGTPMEGSSGSDSSDDSDAAVNEEEDEEEDEDEDLDEIQPDSTSVGVEQINFKDVEGSFTEDHAEPDAEVAPKGKGGKKQLEILELEMRARAIRSMLEKKKKGKGSKPAREQDADLDILKEFEDEDSNAEEVALEDGADTEERKMSVRKLAELKLKAQQEENAIDSSDGLQDGQLPDLSKPAGPAKNLQMKQADILRKAAKLRKKKKKEMADGDVIGPEARPDFKVIKPKSGQRSFRKRASSGRRGEESNSNQQQYSHSYNAYVAAFGDPRLGSSASGQGSWQPRELSVEEEVKALMDELIYRVDPYGDDFGKSHDGTLKDAYYDGSGGYGETTEGETFDGEASQGMRDWSLDPDLRPHSNNSGVFTDDFEETTRDNTRDNSEFSESSDEDRILDGDEVTRHNVDVRSRKINLKFAAKRPAPKSTPAKKLRRKVREEKAITLDDLGPVRPVSMYTDFATMPRPKRMAQKLSHESSSSGPKSQNVPKKKKEDDELEEGELSDDEEEELKDGGEMVVSDVDAEFAEDEDYFQDERRPRADGRASSASRSSASRSPLPGRARYDDRGQRSYSRSSSEGRNSPYRRSWN